MLRTPDDSFEVSDTLILLFSERWIQLSMRNVALAACLPQLAQENTRQGKISGVSLLTDFNSKGDFQRAIFNPSSHQETLITV